jgi:hypothetical protein
MALATKLAVSVVVTLVLMIGALWIALIITTNAPTLRILLTIVFYLGSNATFDDRLTAAVLFFVIGFPIFDALAIACFHFGLDKVDREITIYGGVEGSIGPRISTRQKLMVVYPWFVIWGLVVTVAAIRAPIASILMAGNT